MPAPVAIIIRAKDEMPHVQQMLDMLRTQSFRDYDLFAVDSGSTDGTLEALSSACDPERLTCIAPGAYVPGKVINDAVARTSHAFIVLLNADAVPLDADCLSALLAPLRRDEADAVFARQRARADARFIVDYDYQRAYDPARMAPGFYSAVLCAFRRSVWENHPFRETGYAEDLAWAESCLAAGYRIRFVPEAAVEHSHNYTLRELYRKRRRQAATREDEPRLARQAYACLREIVRDTLHALRRFRPHTIPYNLIYRITIHAAVYHGLKSR